MKPSVSSRYLYRPCSPSASELPLRSSRRPYSSDGSFVSFTTLSGATSIGTSLEVDFIASAAKYERAHGGSRRSYSSRWSRGLQKWVYLAKSASRLARHGYLRCTSP